MKDTSLARDCFCPTQRVTNDLHHDIQGVGNNLDEFRRVFHRKRIARNQKHYSILMKFVLRVVLKHR